MNTTQDATVLVSACLVGLCTRYDNRCKPDKLCQKQLSSLHWVPVCPEQLGGLPTPREAAKLHGGDGYDVLENKAHVSTLSGNDVTAQFIKGANQVLQIAQTQNISTAFLKARSPSCGISNTIGVTAALLQQNGITVKEF